jgi:hypothetical protein
MHTGQGWHKKATMMRNAITHSIMPSWYRRQNTMKKKLIGMHWIAVLQIPDDMQIQSPAILPSMKQ